MKIESHMYALLSNLDLKSKPDVRPSPDSFTSYLIAISEGLGARIQPSANPTGIRWVLRPSIPSQDEDLQEMAEPVNPNGLYPLDPPSNGSAEDIAGSSTAPVNPNGLYPLDPPSSGSAEDIAGSSTAPVNPIGLYPLDPPSNEYA